MNSKSQLKRLAVQQPQRDPTQDDMNSAARGLRMNAMSVAELRALVEIHEFKPLFADRAIEKAARQILSVKTFNHAPLERN